MKWHGETMFEKVCRKVAWIVPRFVVYHCAIRLGAYVTTGKYGDTVVPELGFMDAVKRYSDGIKGMDKEKQQ